MKTLLDAEKVRKLLAFSLGSSVRFRGLLVIVLEYDCVYIVLKRAAGGTGDKKRPTNSQSWKSREVYACHVLSSHERHSLPRAGGKIREKTNRALFLVRIRMLRTTMWKEIVLVCLSADNLATECILVSSRYRTTGFSAVKRDARTWSPDFFLFPRGRRVPPSCSITGLEHILRRGGPPSPGDISIELIRIQWTSSLQITLWTHRELQIEVYWIRIVGVVRFIARQSVSWATERNVDRMI